MPHDFRDKDDERRGRKRIGSQSPDRRRSEEETKDEKKRKRLERLQKWKAKQGIPVQETAEGLEVTDTAKEESKKEDLVKKTEVDALDAFMASTVIPEISAAANAYNTQREQEKIEKAKAMAAGKKLKRPKYLDESDSEEDANLEVTIPTNKVKLVVGPSGTKISEIQKKSKCRVQIQKKPEEMNRAFGSGPEPTKPKKSNDKTTLLIYGDAKGVAIAQRLIDEAIENKEQKRQQRHREYEKKKEKKNRDRQIYHLRHARDYETLGLPMGASKAEAKKAYRKLAVYWHPDKYTGPDKDAAEKKFLEIQRAYQSLMSSDEEQRIEQLGQT